MEQKLTKTKYAGVSIGLCLILVLNFLNWQNEAVALSFGLIYLIFYSFIFGGTFIAKKGWETIFGLIMLLALIAIVGAGAIYLYEFNDYIFVLIILAIPLLLATPYYRAHRQQEKFSLIKAIREYLGRFSKRKEPAINILLVVGYVILAACCFLFLIFSQTAFSIQAPWQVINDNFFPFYFLATLVLTTYLLNSQRTKLPLGLLTIHAFLSSSVALIIYQIGYGFDPFIHQATEKIILESGTITPKPLYYLGQYALVIFLTKLTFIDLVAIDRLLVPVLFATTLPATIFFVFSHWLKKNYALILALAILMIPFSGFIMTTPQNLGNIFFIITILMALVYYRDQINVYVLYFLALATLAIHPLAGIPLFIAVILLHLFKVLYSSYSRHLGLYFLMALVFVIFLPLAFLTIGAEINTDPNLLTADLNWLSWTDKFDLLLNIVYLVKGNIYVLAGALIFWGLFYIARNKLLRNNSGFLVVAAVIFADFLIAKYFLVFPGIIESDAAEFVSRLITLTFYTLLPFFFLGFYFIIKKLWEKDIFTKAFAVFIMTGLITVSLYLSYPRLDQFEPTKFFSLSQSDIRAVNHIEQTAHPEHIVLANQMIGAAAIKEYGFKKYYDNQFYYSMPIGSPRTFYDYYLEMIYEGAAKTTMEKAMREAGVNEAYFVLNSYWRDANKIAGQAIKSAESVVDIDSGAIYIYKYTR